MIVGGEEEVNRLVDNLRQAVHILLFGTTGAGKSTLLHECAARLKAGNRSGPRPRTSLTAAHAVSF